MSDGSKTIGVVSSSRADYGHLYWVLRELAASEAIDLRLYVTGAHLLKEYGQTVEVIRRDGFEVAAEVPCMDEGDDSDAGMARGIGRAVSGFAEAFEQERPDVLVVTADRYEMMGPACAAMSMRIPIAHIEGGERSEGAIDQSVRDALSMMGHVHFATTANAGQRLIEMGEEAWRVHVAGAASLDHLKRSTLLDKTALQQRLGIDLSERPVVACVHPVTLDSDATCEGRAVLDALEQVEGPIVFCFPNADAGGRRLMELAQAFCKRRADAHLFDNLEPITYWSLLKHAACLVGNSSSGVMEAASLGLGAVDVGTRQEGREVGQNVLRVPADQQAVIGSVKIARSDAFRTKIVGLANPYGDGDAARRIRITLEQLELGDRLLRKRLGGKH